MMEKEYDMDQVRREANEYINRYMMYTDKTLEKHASYVRGLEKRIQNREQEIEDLKGQEIPAAILEVKGAALAGLRKVLGDATGDISKKFIQVIFHLLTEQGESVNMMDFFKDIRTKIADILDEKDPETIQRVSEYFVESFREDLIKKLIDKHPYLSNEDWEKLVELVNKRIEEATGINISSTDVE